MSHGSSRESSPFNAALWLAAGAAAGVFVGVLVADRFGGSKALVQRLSGLLKVAGGVAGEEAESEAENEEEEYDEYGAEIVDEEVENDAPDIDERVLAAFEQDPILSERAIEIDTDEPGTVVLRGTMPSSEDVAHAITIARGTPGVTQVENLLRVRSSRTRPAEPSPRR